MKTIRKPGKPVPPTYELTLSEKEARYLYSLVSELSDTRLSEILNVDGKELDGISRINTEIFTGLHKEFEFVKN